jgi:hypothetical protein
MKKQNQTHPSDPTFEEEAEVLVAYQLDFLACAASLEISLSTRAMRRPDCPGRHSCETVSARYAIVSSRELSSFRDHRHLAAMLTA